MATVTAEIKRLLKLKDRNVDAGAVAIRGLLVELRRQVVGELSAVSGESYTSVMLKQNLASFERYIAAFESAGGAQINSLLDAAWEAGGDLVPEAMRTGGLSVAFGHIPGPLLATLKDFSVNRISSLASDTFNKIRGELTLGILGQKTPHQVIQAVAGGLDGKNVFKSIRQRAETIVKLEMGRAYSAATVESITQAVRTVPEMMKEWWHAGHPAKPRISHLNLNGQKKPVAEPFSTVSLVIDFPRAPSAPIEEVIHCGCEVVPWHPKWAA